MIYPTPSSHRESLLIALQACQVLFLAVHDWVPLALLNDVSAVRSQNTAVRLAFVTLLQTLPFAFGSSGAWPASALPTLTGY